MARFFVLISLWIIKWTAHPEEASGDMDECRHIDVAGRGNICSYRSYEPLKLDFMRLGRAKINVDQIPNV
jgi:hypothetical protein